MEYRIFWIVRYQHIVSEEAGRRLYPQLTDIEEPGFEDNQQTGKVEILMNWYVCN